MPINFFNMNNVKNLLMILTWSILIGWVVHRVELKQNKTTESLIVDDLLQELPQEEPLQIINVDKSFHGKSVTATYYNSVPEQCWGDPLVTASGKRIDLDLLENEEIKWIAVSRDILKEFKFGTKIKVVCKEDPSINGIYEIADTMHEKFENKIDLLWPVGKKGRGRWTVTIYKV